jgi:hypothetical protein
VLTLSKERPGGHDAEADAQAVNDTTQQRDDLVSEERGDREKDQDGNRYQPASGDGTDLLGDGREFLAPRTGRVSL